jgi:hypothetical protein
MVSWVQVAPPSVVPKSVPALKALLVACLTTSQPVRLSMNSR